MDVLLIPSCGIGPALNQLCPVDTELRLKRGLELWREGGYDRLLVVGGIFSPPQIQTVSAAELMKGWLVERGVAGEDILCESTSLDTYENVSKGLKILRASGLGDARITVVTQWQHAMRFWLTFFLGHGIRVRTVPMRYPISSSTFRWEMVFILHHAVFPTGEGSPLVARNRKRRAREE